MPLSSRYIISIFSSFTMHQCRNIIAAEYRISKFKCILLLYFYDDSTRKNGMFEAAAKAGNIIFSIKIIVSGL